MFQRFPPCFPAMGVAETTSMKEAFQKVKNDLCNEAHQVWLPSKPLRKPSPR